MKHFSINPILTFSGLFFIVLFGAIGCTMENCEKIDTFETDTYVFLVHRNNDSLVESITIEDYNNGKGLMKTPEIIGRGFSRTFDLTIDKVSSDKWNFNAKGANQSGTVAEGSGFFKSDTIFVEIKWELGGIKDSDVFSGTR